MPIRLNPPLKKWCARQRYVKNIGPRYKGLQKECLGALAAPGRFFIQPRAGGVRHFV